MKKLAVVTGSRAEYGQLRPFLRLARESSAFELQLIVAGSHLWETYGATVHEIERDGFPIGTVVRAYPGDTPTAAVRNLAGHILGFSQAYTDLKPDSVLVEGDRAEALAAAMAAGYMHIPLAHGGGGDVTGTVDNSARHAISHFARIHFVSTEGAADRLSNLLQVSGEIHVTGGLGIDAIMQMEWCGREETLSGLGLPEGSRYLLVGFHPESGHEQRAGEWMDNILRACYATGLHVIVTYPNSDPGSAGIITAIERHSAHTFPSLGSDRYLHALKYADALVGNSSSGLYEAPSLRVPVVNVGGRQEGRLKAANVVDAGYGYESIREIIEYVTGTFFRRGPLLKAENPYGDGHAAERMLAVIERRLGDDLG